MEGSDIVKNRIISRRNEIYQKNYRYKTLILINTYNLLNIRKKAYYMKIIKY